MRIPRASIKLTLAFLTVLGLCLAMGGGLGRFVPASHADAGDHRTCTIASERGDWGYQYSGTIDGVGPFVGVGVETCDGSGHCVGTDTSTLAGNTVTQHFTTVETINPDCSGGSTLTFENGTSAHSRFTIVNDRTELDFIGADPGALIQGVQKRR